MESDEFVVEANGRKSRTKRGNKFSEVTMLTIRKHDAARGR